MRIGVRSAPAARFPGVMDRRAFQALARIYRRDTGFTLMAIEADGRWLGGQGGA